LLTETRLHPSTDSFDWEKRSVIFRGSTAIPSAWTYTGPDVPPPAATARINLWLFRGAPPRNGKQVEIVVTRFTFTPAG
jgi:hypothetical protein